MRFHRDCLAAMAALLVLAAPAGAAERTTPQAPAATPAVDPEEQIDEGLKNFGYLTGLSLSCVATGQRGLLEAEAVDLNAEVSRLLGVDRAFLFAAGFGYGSTVKVDLSECKTVLQRYEARVSKFRAGRGGKR